MHEWAEQDEVKWSVGSSVVESKCNVRTDNYVQVRAIDLSEFLYRFNTRIKLLKMDIEGAEYPTLMKIMERGIAAEIEHIVVETHARKIPELQPAHAALVKLIETTGSKNVDLTWI
jgi:FkbM family methyltransferase